MITTLYNWHGIMDIYKYGEAILDDWKWMK